MLHVTGHHDGAVLGPVPAVEEDLAVRKLVGHVLDVFQEPERRMLVGVPGEGRVLHRLLQLEERRGGVLVVLAEHGPGLFLERRLIVLEVLEPVGLDLDGRAQRRGWNRHVIARPVIGREGIGIGAQRLEDVVVLLLRVLLGAAEHHVLEEVGEAREPLFHLVARPGADHRVIGDDSRRVKRDGDHGQAVVQGCLLDRKRKDRLSLGLSWSGRGSGYLHEEHDHRREL